MINKTDRELELEKRLEGIKDDLEELVELNIRGSKGSLFSNGYRHALWDDAEDLQAVIDKHFPTEYEYGEIK